MFQLPFYKSYNLDAGNVNINCLCAITSYSVEWSRYPFNKYLRILLLYLKLANFYFNITNWNATTR